MQVSHQQHFRKAVTYTYMDLSIFSFWSVKESLFFCAFLIWANANQSQKLSWLLAVRCPVNFRVCFFFSLLWRVGTIIKYFMNATFCSCEKLGVFFTEFDLEVKSSFILEELYFESAIWQCTLSYTSFSAFIALFHQKYLWELCPQCDAELYS